MLKAIIWIVTLLGLLPITLFALAHLISMISIARLPKEPPEPGTLSVIGDVSIQVGPGNKLHLSTHVWPSVLVVVGALSIFLGLLFLLPKQPDRVRVGGFFRIESYIDRLLRSRKDFASVIVATTDGQHALLVTRRSDGTVLHVGADRTKSDGEESRTREFFKQLGMAPVREYLAANGGVKDATCNFEFSLTGDAETIARLCVSVFTNLFGVTNQQELEFRAEGL